MMVITQTILFFSAISFIIYGINSFFSKRMVLEYERWGFKNQRILLGCFQLLGGLGLLVGLKVPLMLSVASFLLLCMMVTAVFVRIRTKERIVQMLPALLYVVLTFIIFYNSVA